MPKVTDEHRSAQRERIQQAAMAVARRKGLGGMTMGDIIRESGLSAGAIYGYYAGKDELVADVATTILGDRRAMVAAIARRTPLPTPSAMLDELLSTIPAHLLDGGLLLQFWGEMGPDGAVRRQARDNLRSMLDGIEEYLRAWFTHAGLDADEAATRAARLAPAVGALAQGYVLQAGTLGTVEPGAYLAAVDDLLSGALASPATT